MQVTKITPNIILQTQPDFNRKSRVGSIYPLTHRLESDNVLHAMPYYQPSFGSLKIPPVAEALERKGAKLAKRYLVDANGSIHIKVDKKSALGEKPILFWNYVGEETQVLPSDVEEYGIDSHYRGKWLNDYLSEMKFDGEFYHDVPGPAQYAKRVYYAVFYKDTKKWDDNGGLGYEIDPRKLINKAEAFDRKEFGHPLVKIVRKGHAKGRVVMGSTLAEFLRNLPKSEEPTIAVVEDFMPKGEKDRVGDIPKNVQGVIFTKTTEATLGHAAATVRNQISASAMLYDDKQVEELRKMEGKFISLEVSPQEVKWEQIEASEAEMPKAVKPPIQVPEIRTTDKLLTSAEYEPDIVGPKAYNLRRLEEMKQRGGLEDVEIPRSFAIPCGVFDKILAANPESAKDIAKIESEIDEAADIEDVRKALNQLHDKYSHLQFPDDVKKEMMDFYQKSGLDILTVRSAFNGEDAKGYSAAGLYHSNFCDAQVEGELVRVIKDVWRSKWYYSAYMSRRANNINHNAIKPTVLVQDFIIKDYKFTLYTNDPSATDGRQILIEMLPGKSLCNDPYIVKYDRDTHEVEIESIARRGRKITLDEDMNVVDAEPINDPIKNDLERWKAKLKKVCEAALEVEREFGAPQDIEGGIKFTKDGDVDTSQIYFWQAREQVV